MLKLVKNDQRNIDYIFEDPADKKRRPLHEEVFRFAQIGIETPDELSSDQIQRICFALAVNYAQMGIGSP